MAIIDYHLVHNGQYANLSPSARILIPVLSTLCDNITGAMKHKGMADYDQFRRAVLEATGVSVCTRLHFGRALEGETEYYVRLAYSGIDISEIEEGLQKLKVYLES